MKTVTLNVDGISQGQWSTFLLELNLMKKAWKSYGVDVKLKAHSINKIIEKGTSINDPRVEGRVLHPFKDVIMLSLIAILAGAQSWVEVELFGEQKFDWLSKVLSRLNWGLPQIHDTLLVRSVPKAEWIDFILPKLDLDKMVNERSGLPFNDKTIREALSEVYDNIATEGMATFKPGTNSYGKSFANRRTDHRFLAFKNADAWMEYQTRFGNPDPFVTMMEHINGMSRDIALLKTLGPNPDATHTFLLQSIKKQATLDTVAEAQGKFKRKKILIIP